MQQKATASKTSKTIEVEFNRLIPGGTVNARAEAERKDGIDELAALIKAKGLLQPLIVRPRGTSQYEVTAGNRRLAAIGKLIKAKDWTGKVPVVVRDEGDAEALETSLIENTARLPMHEVDQFKVFARVHADGAAAADIASRYGVSERTVRQRLALGALAPEVLEAWRKGGIAAGTAQAFAITADKKLQAKTFAALKRTYRFSPAEVRQALIKDKPRLTDSRIVFVGLDRYKAAGGEVVESLFADDGYLADGALLARLTEERLEERCKELVADGWSFALPADQAGNEWYSWGRLQPAQKGKATPAEKKRLSTIAAELNKISKRADKGSEDPDDYDRQDALESEQMVLEETIAARGFTAAQKAKAGCVIDLDGDRVDITYGVVRDSKPKIASRAENKTGIPDEPAGRPGDGRPIVPNALLVDLGALQTEAAAFALAQSPAVAIAVAAAGMRSKYDAWGVGNSPVRLKPDGMRRGAAGWARTEADGNEDLGETDELDDEQDLEDDEKENGTKSSGFAAALAAMGPLTAMSSIVEVGRHLAVEIGRALDLRQVKYKPVALADVAALIEALPGDLYLAKVRELVSLEDYFKRAPAAIAIAAIEEMGGTPQKGAKKADLAIAAASNGKDCGWLPAELRHPDYKLLRRLGDPPARSPTPAKAKGAKRKGTA